MNPAAPRRVRRPRDKEEVIQRLLATQEGPFGEIRDVLTFAAALGYKHNRKVPLTATGEAIRWETAKNRRGTEPLVGMLALASSEDGEVVADDRFDEQIRFFEEYANGGLEILGEILNRSPRLAREVVLELVQADLQPGSDEPDPLGLGGPDI
jgi:dnd system-associated protein 4